MLYYFRLYLDSILKCVQPGGGEAEDLEITKQIPTPCSPATARQQRKGKALPNFKSQCQDDVVVSRSTEQAWTFCTQSISLKPGEVPNARGGRPWHGPGAEPDQRVWPHWGRVLGVSGPGQWAGPALALERLSARGVNSTLRRGGAGEPRAGAGCVRPSTCH